MKYDIAIDTQRCLIMVQYAGTITLADRTQAVQDTEKKLTETGYRRVLVDLSGSKLAHQSVEEETRFANILGENKVLKQSKIAYFSKSDQSGNGFIEIIARAQNCRLKHFFDINDAHEWLAQD